MQHINDSQGRCIGKLIDQGEDQMLTDANGRPLARYDSSQNITTLPNGHLIGRGNLMMTQLPQR